VKETKQSAEYAPHSKLNHCEHCQHWRAGTCTEVQGAISPDGTCKYFERVPKNVGRKT